MLFVCSLISIGCFYFCLLATCICLFMHLVLHISIFWTLGFLAVAFLSIIAWLFFRTLANLQERIEAIEQKMDIKNKHTN